MCASSLECLGPPQGCSGLFEANTQLACSSPTQFQPLQVTLPSKVVVLFLGILVCLFSVLLDFTEVRDLGEEGGCTTYCLAGLKSRRCRFGVLMELSVPCIWSNLQSPWSQVIAP